MTGARLVGGQPGTEATKPSAIVWIDAREAVIASWHDGSVDLERLESEVPPHRKATGHVRHEPMVRHGGGGREQNAGEPHRLEHLERFLNEVADRVPAAADLLVLGSGTVHERLAHRLGQADIHHRRERRIQAEPCPRLTERQLIARLRAFAGVVTRRRSVGAHRWIEPEGAPTEREAAEREPAGGRRGRV